MADDASKSESPHKAAKTKPMPKETSIDFGKHKVGNAVPSPNYDPFERLSASGHIYNLRGLGSDPDLSRKVGDLESELTEIRQRLVEQTNALQEEKSGAKKQKQEKEALEKTLNELKVKEQIRFLLDRVGPPAQRQLLDSDEFRQLFFTTRECNAVVMSVDIRRSTELMLKARKPEAYAQFITTLCSDLMKIIIEANGVFDKFTGDGVLAFFPQFYSGDDATYFAISAADRCHRCFNEHYRAHRKSFTSVLTDIGLGIGLDYGPVHLVQVAGGLTVVGAPVVYACRLSGAPAGITLMNQPAYETVTERFGAKCFIDEKTIEIKHEGNMLSYAVRLNGQEHKPQIPEWLTKTALGADKSA
jgi:class 3 adenylate cyclase